MHLFRLTLGLAVGVLSLAGCGPSVRPDGGGTPAPGPNPTPEAVYERASAAADKKDWKAFLDCCDPQSDTFFLFFTALPEIYAYDREDDLPSEVQSRFKEYLVTLKRHGARPSIDIPPVSLNDPEAWNKFDRQLYGQVADRTALVADLIPLLDLKTLKAGVIGMDLTPNIKGSLSDVRINGTLATGNLKVPNFTEQVLPKPEDRALQFVKRGQSWYLVPDSVERYYMVFAEEVRSLRTPRERGAKPVLGLPEGGLPVEIKLGDTPTLTWFLWSGKGVVLAHVTVQPTTRYDMVEAKIVAFRRLWRDDKPRAAYEYRETPQVLQIPFQDENGVQWTLLDGSNWRFNDTFFISKKGLKARVKDVPDYGSDGRWWWHRVGATSASDGVDKVLRAGEIATKVMGK